MEVTQQIRAAGLLDRARGYYVALGLILAGILGGCVAGFILLGDSWLQLIVAAVLGVVFTQVAFIGHEAGHRQVLAGRQANTHLARVLSGLIGLSYDWWESKHARHHANPNRVGKDPDIAPGVISFVRDDAVRSRGPVRWIARRQGWLFFPLLTLEGLNLHVSSLRHMVISRDAKHRPAELSLIIGRSVLLALPLFLMLPPGMAFAFLGVQLAVFGVYMGASFAPNHKGMPIIAPGARLDFFSKQVRTSRNIAGGWWATALLGGLNYQVEHHLFPSMPRRHLAAAREIVRAKCAALEIPYTEVPLHRSYAIVVRYLNEVGLAARDPFECPVLAEYR